MFRTGIFRSIRTALERRCSRVCSKYVSNFNYFKMIAIVFYSSLIIGLTQYSERAHICRALLEALCLQTRFVLQNWMNSCVFKTKRNLKMKICFREVLEAMNSDAKIELQTVIILINFDYINLFLLFFKKNE